MPALGNSRLTGFPGADEDKEKAGLGVKSDGGKVSLSEVLGENMSVRAAGSDYLGQCSKGTNAHVAKTRGIQCLWSVFSTVTQSPLPFMTFNAFLLLSL